ncbi:MAG: hypothetical protein KDA80_21015 [Planctomycetaceae bacterium]|nr:hypothetical protein [Planctomycetaceae bacterium]
MILVEMTDGRCRSCGGQLQIVGADDVSLDVECLNEKCADGYTVETDSFADGGIHYWRLIMAELENGAEE